MCTATNTKLTFGDVATYKLFYSLYYFTLTKPASIVHFMWVVVGSVQWGGYLASVAWVVFSCNYSGVLASFPGLIRAWERG